jgi:hypothetical protein
LETEGPNRVIQDVVRSSEISIWKAAGGVEEQMYSPQTLSRHYTSMMQDGLQIAGTRGGRAHTHASLIDHPFIVQNLSV